MGNFSIDPQQNLKLNRQKGYVGVRIEQGVPVLDRDLNLLGDVIAASVREIVDRYIGSGAAPGEEGFFINEFISGGIIDLQIGAGSYLVGGLLVTSTGQTYSSQADVPPILPPPSSASRNDAVYLDVWLAEVDEKTDATLSNAGDVRMQTSVRVKPMWKVRVATGTEQLPPAPEGHIHALLANLVVFKNGAARVEDRRTRTLSLPDCLRRLTVLEQALRPMFGGQQIDVAMSWANQVVRLFGSGFNVGNVRVTLTTLDNKVSQPAIILGTPSFDQLTIRVPSNITGECTVTVTTDLGSATATTTRLFVHGPPSFKAPPGQLSATSAPFSPVGKPVQIILNGNHFTGPNVKVFFGTHPSPSVEVLGLTQLRVVVPPGLPLNQPHVVSVQTDVSPTPAVSTETFTMTSAK